MVRSIEKDGTTEMEAMPNKISTQTAKNLKYLGHSFGLSSNGLYLSLEMIGFLHEVWNNFEFWKGNHSFE